MRRKPPYMEDADDILEGAGARGGYTYGSRQTFRSPATPKSPEASEAAKKIQAFNKYDADDLHEAVTARAYGKISPKETPKIREAADNIENYLGGKIKPEDIKASKSNDLAVEKNGKKFRMDVKDPGKTKDRKTPDDPHFHFEQFDEELGWVDATDSHRGYFKKD